MIGVVSFAAAQLAADREPVLARQHQVEHQQVEALARPQLVHRRRVLREEDVEALLGEVTAQQVAQPLVVVDDEDLVWGRGIHADMVMRPASPTVTPRPASGPPGCETCRAWREATARVDRTPRVVARRDTKRYKSATTSRSAVDRSPLPSNVAVTSVPSVGDGAPDLSPAPPCPSAPFASTSHRALRLVLVRRAVVGVGVRAAARARGRDGASRRAGRGARADEPAEHAAGGERRPPRAGPINGPRRITAAGRSRHRRRRQPAPPVDRSRRPARAG